MGQLNPPGRRVDSLVFDYRHRINQGKRGKINAELGVVFAHEILWVNKKETDRGTENVRGLSYCLNG